MTGQQTAKILVIDDEQAICDIIVDVAREIGCAAQSSVEKRDILLKIESEWDCIVVDLTMPDLDGVEVLRLLAAKECCARIILISGFSMSILESARKLGEIRGLNIVETLTKPIDIDVLENALKAALEANTPVSASPVARQDFLLDWSCPDVDSGGILPYYQPKVDIRTGCLAGYEALARWWHPQKGLLPPSAFIPQAIEAGEIDKITMAMVQRVAADIGNWLKTGDTSVVAINIEAGSLANLEFPGQIEAILSANAVPSGNLILEVTETGIFENLADAMDSLIRFRVKGHAVSIDDFGTGHSTLSQLHDFPFNQLKIDRSFVSEIGKSSHAEKIVASTIDLAHQLDMEVVAEGVEDLETINFLRHHGCDQLQGYYFAKPMNVADISLWRSQQSTPILSAA